MLKKLRVIDIVLLLLFVVSFIFFAIGQFKKVHNKRLTLENNEIAKIAWLKDSVLYLDSIVTGTVLKFDAPFKNTSNNKLFVRNISTSCGCTNTSLNKDNILSGDTAHLTGTINTTGKLGNEITIISFNTNTLQKRHTLQLKYFVKNLFVN
jgi:hypothetical protein